MRYTYQNSGEQFVHEKLMNTKFFRNKPTWTNLHVVDPPQTRLCELDIVFLTELGLWCFEVKSGSVTREGNVWNFQTYSDTRDPFIKLTESSFSLVNSVKKIITKQKLNFSGVNVFYCICFTDINFNQLSVSWDTQYILDKAKLTKSIDKFLETLQEFHISGSRVIFPALDTDLQIRISESISSNFCIPLSLKELLERSSNEISEFSEYQQRILGNIDQLNFVLVDGVPGSGKSLIAKKILQSLKAYSEKKILYLCSNKEFLNQFFPQDKFPNKKYTFFTINELLEDTFGLANINNKTEIFNNQSLRSKLFSAFDVIIFDEAQDYFWKSFDSFLFAASELMNKKIFVFFDSEIQKFIFNEKLDLKKLKILKEKKYTLFPLPVNMRNSSSIASEAKRISQFDFKSFQKERGLFEEINENNVEKLFSIIESKLTLLRSEGINTQNIVFLSYTTLEKSIYSKNHSRFSDLGIVAFNEKNKKEQIPVYPATRFKGLEAEIVFIIDFQMPLTQKMASFTCMAVTRAKHICYLIHAL